MAKQIKFNEEARASIKKGIDKLAAAAHGSARGMALLAISPLRTHNSLTY